MFPDLPNVVGKFRSKYITVVTQRRQARIAAHQQTDSRQDRQVVQQGAQHNFRFVQQLGRQLPANQAATGDKLDYKDTHRTYP